MAHPRRERQTVTPSSLCKLIGLSALRQSKLFLCYFPSEYFNKTYGKCELAYLWKKDSSDPEYEADGVPNFLNFAVVVKFEESSTANKVKQK